jgi:hypothetical protein
MLKPNVLDVPFRILEGLGFPHQQFLVNSGGLIFRRYVPYLEKSLIVGQNFVDVIGNENAIRRAFDHSCQQDVREGELLENLAVLLHITDSQCGGARTAISGIIRHQSELSTVKALCDALCFRAKKSEIGLIVISGTTRPIVPELDVVFPVDPIPG